MFIANEHAKKSNHKKQSKSTSVMDLCQFCIKLSITRFVRKVPELMSQKICFRPKCHISRQFCIHVLCTGCQTWSNKQIERFRYGYGKLSQKYWDCCSKHMEKIQCHAQVFLSDARGLKKDARTWKITPGKERPHKPGLQ